MLFNHKGQITAAFVSTSSGDVCADEYCLVLSSDGKSTLFRGKRGFLARNIFVPQRYQFLSFHTGNKKRNPVVYKSLHFLVTFFSGNNELIFKLNVRGRQIS